MSNKIQFIQLEDGTQQISETGIITFDAGSILRVDTSTISNSLDVVNVEYLTNNSSSLYTQDGTLTANRIVNSNGNTLRFDASSGYLATPFEFRGYPFGGSGTNPYLKQKGYGEIEILGTLTDLLTVKNGSGSTILDVNNGNAAVNGTFTVASSYFKVQTTSKAMNFYHNGGSSLVHDIQTGIGFPDKVRFNILGGDRQFIVGGSALIGTEKISLQEDTLISKKLELSTTDDGFLMPRLTTLQMNGITTPDTHLVIFNTDLNALYRWNGTAWVAMSAGYGIIEVKDSSGNPTFYADLQTAINATSAVDTVKIHSEIQLTATVNIPGRTSLTINFQGNRIYGDTSGGDFNLFTITQSNGGNRRDLQFIGGGVLETIGTVTAVGSAMPFSALNPGNDIFRLYAGETQIRSINGNCFYTNGMDLIKGGIFYSENAGASFGGTIEDISLDVYNRPTFGYIVRYCKLITRNSGFFVSQNTKIHNCFIKGPVTSTGNYGLLYIHRGTECYDNYLEQTDTSASGRDALYIRGSSPNATGIDGRVSGNTCINRGVGDAGNLVYGSAYDNYFFSESGNGLRVGNNCKTITNNKCFTNAASGKQALNSQAEETIKNYVENVNSSNAEPALTISSASGQTHEAHGNTAIVANNSASNIKLFGPGALYISNNIMGLLGTGLDLNGNTNSQTNTTDAYGNLKIG